MAGLKGAKEYEKFQKGDKLTRKQAMKAQCYECNGFEEGSEDCLGVSCPMYQFRLYPNKKSAKHPKSCVDGS
jgi:hypothetical protein